MISRNIKKSRISILQLDLLTFKLSYLRIITTSTSKFYYVIIQYFLISYIITFPSRSLSLGNCCFPVTRLAWATESPGGNPPLQWMISHHLIQLTSQQNVQMLQQNQISKFARIVSAINVAPNLWETRWYNIVWVQNSINSSLSCGSVTNLYFAVTSSLIWLEWHSPTT